MVHRGKNVYERYLNGIGGKSMTGKIHSLGDEYIVKDYIFLIADEFVNFTVF